MYNGKTSAHIFDGHDSKIIDAYKAKDNSGKEFLGAFQDRVRAIGVPTKLVAYNTHMSIDWKITKYLCNPIVPLWQCETKHQHQNLAENRYETVK